MCPQTTLTQVSYTRCQPLVDCKKNRSTLHYTRWSTTRMIHAARSATLCYITYTTSKQWQYLSQQQSPWNTNQYEMVWGLGKINPEKNMTALRLVLFTTSYFLSCGRAKIWNDVPNWTLFIHYCYLIPNMPQKTNHIHNTTCSTSYCLVTHLWIHGMYVWYMYLCATLIMNQPLSWYGETFVLGPFGVITAQWLIMALTMQPSVLLKLSALLTADSGGCAV